MLLLAPVWESALLAPGSRTSARTSARSTPALDVGSLYQRLLTASELVNSDGRVVLTAEDRATALADMHLEPRLGSSGEEGAALYAWHETSPGRTERVRNEVHPDDFLPAHVFSAEPVDVTELVTETFPAVLEAHPIFASMANELMSNDDFYQSVYFGTEARDTSCLDFPALCRRLVASVHLFESLIGQERAVHRQLAQHYEWQYEAAVRQSRELPFRWPASPRYALMGFFLTLKGESVLASINAFEMLQRLSSGKDSSLPDLLSETSGPESASGASGASGASADPSALAALSDILNDIMSLNIVEAVISNLSFAFWPDNARAGMALLLAPDDPFRADLTQALDEEWFRLYLAWNANFIWPSHYCADMMCFTMLLMPTIALGSPERFQYNRAHTLFWVVRSTQLTRMKRAAEQQQQQQQQQAVELPVFHCRQLEPMDDRQPLTSRTAKLTRASGEALARKHGDDVAEGSAVWWRLAVEVLPKQLRSMASLYGRMPKSGPFKLRLL